MKRGKKSAADISIVTALPSKPPPDPPLELTAEQAESWHAIVTRLPGEWFPPESHAVLVQLCRHTVAARRIAQLVAQQEQSEEFNVGDYVRLLAAQEKESRVIAALARTLRLTPQSRLRAETAATRAKAGPVGPKPWELGEQS